MKKEIVHYVIVSSLLLSSVGCATLTSGPVKKVVIESSPSGAQATWVSAFVGSDNKAIEAKKGCVTPCTLYASGFKNLKVRVEKDGYETEEKILTTRFQKRFWFNVLFWPGAVLDLVSGSAWRLEPNKLDVKLSKK